MNKIQKPAKKCATVKYTGSIAIAIINIIPSKISKNTKDLTYFKASRIFINKLQVKELKGQ